MHTCPQNAIVRVKVCVALSWFLNRNGNLGKEEAYFMLLLLHYCISAGNIHISMAKNCGILYTNYDTCEVRRVCMRFLAYLFCIHGIGLCVACDALLWRQYCIVVAYHSCMQRTHTAFLHGLSLVHLFFVLGKIHSKPTRSHCVSSELW